MDHQGLHNLHAHAKNVSLTADEKSAGREMLLSYMRLTPHRAATSMAAAASVSAKKKTSFFQHYLGKPASVMALSMLVMFTASGVSYAAEGSVPGERLYVVKIGFNEPLRSALSVTAEGRAVWEAERASRRLAEAEELARRGTLKLETRVALDEEFRRHAEGAELRLAKVQHRKGEGAAADVAAHIEGTLRAHRQIMNAIVEDRRQKKLAVSANANAKVTGDNVLRNDITDNSDDSQVAALIASADREITSAERRRGEKEKERETTGSDAARTFAQGRRDVALARISEVHVWLSDRGSKLSAEALAATSSGLADANEAIIKGNAALEAQQYRDAAAAYAQAQRVAQETKLLAVASERFKVNSFAAMAAAGSSDDENDDDERRNDDRSREANHNSHTEESRSGVRLQFLQY